jgi:hypothetical protein
VIRRFPAAVRRVFLQHELSGCREQITRRFQKEFGDIVQSGPFKGMEILPESSWADGDRLPKLLGSYESELHRWISQIPTRHYDTILDIGCAEGYTRSVWFDLRPRRPCRTERGACPCHKVPSEWRRLNLRNGVPPKKSVLVETVEFVERRRLGCRNPVYPFRLPCFSVPVCFRTRVSLRTEILALRHWLLALRRCRPRDAMAGQAKQISRSP